MHCCCTSEPDNENTHLLAAVYSMNDEQEGGERVALPEVSAVVQFSTSMYFCTEGEGEVVLNVIRLGDLTGVATFTYRTKDGSAKSPEKYEAGEGTMRFEPGQSEVKIPIQILQDEQWDSTLEFQAVITEVSGARMGKYLNHCRVSIIDDDAFPTNVFRQSLLHREDATSGAFTQMRVSGIRLIIEYVKMNLSRREIFRGTVAFVVLDFVKSLYFLYALFLQMYLVDVVIMGEQKDSPESDLPLLVAGDRRMTAVAVGVLYVVPLALLQTIDLMKIYQKVGGRCRKALQENLARKFLNYKEESRSKISSGDITMAVMRDTLEVVDNGYMKVLAIFRILGKLVLVLLFVLRHNKAAAIPLFCFPLVMTVFLCFRQSRTVTCNDKMALMENHLMQMVNNAINNVRLISDFHLRPQVVKHFEECITRFNARKLDYLVMMTNNMYLGPWLTTWTIGVYMVFGTFELKQFGGGVSLGTFLATIHVFKEIGSELQLIYGETMEMLTSVGPLWKLTYFMNLETEVEERMRSTRARLMHGEASLQLARACIRTQSNLDEALQVDDAPPRNLFAVDMLDIRFKDLSFRFEGEEPLLKNFTADFPQGRFCVFVGPAHEGKATILKLVGQVLLPESGDIIVPPHLRILHMTRETYVLNHPLLKNIVLDRDFDRAGGFSRVRRICERLGFSRMMLEFLDAPEDEDEENPNMIIRSKWATSCSNSDFARINLARALVMNPEVLVAHMPFGSFNDTELDSIVSVVRAHVDERGLEQTSHDTHMRRLRSVFCSSPQLRQGHVAVDMIYHISLDGGIQEHKLASTPNVSNTNLPNPKPGSDG